MYLYILADFVGCTLFGFAWRWLSKDCKAITALTAKFLEPHNIDRAFVDTVCHVMGIAQRHFILWPAYERARYLPIKGVFHMICHSLV